MVLDVERQRDEQKTALASIKWEAIDIDDYAKKTMAKINPNMLKSIDNWSCAEAMEFARKQRLKATPPPIIDRTAPLTR